MKKLLVTLIVGLSVLFSSNSVIASIIHHDFNVEAPGGFFTALVDLDQDGVSIKEAGFHNNGAQQFENFALVHTGIMSSSLDLLTTGDIVDSTTAMISATKNYALVFGLNYIGTYGVTSCANCFGFIELDFDGQDIFLTGFTYETIANQEIQIMPQPSIPVPEPGSIALLGAGLFGLAFMRRKKA